MMTRFLILALVCAAGLAAPLTAQAQSKYEKKGDIPPGQWCYVDVGGLYWCYGTTADAKRVCDTTAQLDPNKPACYVIAAEVTSCPSGQVYDGTARVCVGGDTGRSCTSGTWADYTGGVCVTTCPYGQVYDWTNGSCTSQSTCTSQGHSCTTSPTQDPATGTTCGSYICTSGQVCSQDADGNPMCVSSGSTGTIQVDSSFVPLAPIPGLNADSSGKPLPPTSSGIATFLNNLYTFAIGIAVVLAIIMVIWGGIQYATQDSPFGKSSGREKIQNALFGLLLVLAPVLVFTIINPAILNLSVAMPPLQTAWSTLSGGGAGSSVGSGTGNVPTDGCNTPTGTYLKAVSCGSDSAATTWINQCESSGGRGLKTQAWSCGTKVTGNSGCPNQVPAKAVCATKSASSFMFVNRGLPWSTWTIFTPYDLQAVSNHSSYAGFQSFSATCTSDGGRVCTKPGSSVTCPSGISVPEGQSGKCYNEPTWCAYPPMATDYNYFAESQTSTCNVRS